MSAHAGIHYFDQRPIPPATLSTLATTLAAYGPDGGADAHPAPGVALLARHLRVTPEDDHDRQPLALAGGAWLTWDGRLDNRIELAMELALRADAVMADADIVGHAIGRWGQDAWRRLVGDWSAALWDTPTRTVVLASDFMAVRPLYHVLTDVYCAWSTALEGLVALTDRRADLDDDYLRAYVMSCRMPGRTPYREIHALPAGHSLRLGAACSAPQRYWHLSHDEVRHRDPRDYVSRFRGLLAAAVRGRLRSTRPVWMELSGGWDSSSVVCMAARLAAQGDAVAPSLRTGSYVSPQHPEADETRFIETVEAHTGLPFHHVELDHQAARQFPNPVHLRHIDTSRLALYAAVRAHDARVLLSGRLGDGVMGNFPVDVTSIAADLRALAPRRLFGDLRRWGKASGRTAWELLHEALITLLPIRFEVDAMCRDILGIGSRPRAGAEDAASWPVPAAGRALFRDIVATQVRWVRAEAGAGVSRHFAAALALYSLNRELASPPEATGLVVSYPLADRRLVDYLASIPAEVLCAPGAPRALMRAAMAPLLPERIARRFSKSYAAPYAARHVQAQIAPLLARVDRLIVVERGYVDGAFLRNRLEAARVSAEALASLQAIVSLEHWLERIEGLRSAAA